MTNIIDHLTWEVYLYIQRGLFERHKLPFALILATKILTSAGKVCTTCSPTARLVCEAQARLPYQLCGFQHVSWLAASACLQVAA